MEIESTRGQSAAEYALLIGIVAIGALAVLTLLGQNIQNTTETMSEGGNGIGGIMGEADVSATPGMSPLVDP